MTVQIQLSKSQRQAVEAPWKGKINLILATAGSGKTLALSRRAVKVARDLVESDALNSRLLCVCFNKSAADEMAERLLDIVQSTGLMDSVAVTRRAYWPKDMVTIEVRTFHALGYWILRSSSQQERATVGLRAGRIKLLAAKDVRVVIREALLESGQINPSTPDRTANGLSRACERKINAHKRRIRDLECEQLLTPVSESNTLPHLVFRELSPRTYECYVERMNGRNCIDFEDMICKAVKLVTAHENARARMRARYTAVLVDEFQDLTPAEFLLCKVLVESTRSLTFVGDDDQQIYSFRSSRTWFAHETLQRWFSQDVQVLHLPENRRCPGGVVKSSSAMIRSNSRRATKEIVPVRADGSPVRIIACKKQGLEVNFVVKRVKAILPRIKGTRDQILVLFRTNSLLHVFQEAFNAAGVPTSRVLTDPRRTETIGPKTSAAFALITLMSRTADRATFTWAAVTVSPLLERTVVQTIIGSNTLAGKAKSEPVPADGISRDRDQLPGAGDRNNRPFPSPFLEQMTEWFKNKKDNNMDCPLDPAFEAVFVLLERAEQLLLRLRHVSTTADLVKCAEEIVSADAAGEFDAYAEMEASQQELSQSPFDESRAGYELLQSTARKLDEDEDEEDMNAPSKKEADIKVEDENEDEDFSSLFSRDKNRRSHKRQKHMRGAAVVSEPAAQQKARVGKMIQSFCDMLDATLTKSDRKAGGKVSRTERPATVLSTVHNAKGSTFAYVFLCGANMYNIPVHGYLEMTSCGSIDLQSLASQEERRVFFVSLTRTQKEFVCTYSSIEELRSQHIVASQSPFLGEMKTEMTSDRECICETFVENEQDVEKALGLFHSASVAQTIESGSKEETARKPTT